MNKIKVVLFTQYGEYHAGVVLESLLEEKGIEILAVVTSSCLIHGKSLLAAVVYIMKRCGLRYFLMRAYEGLYFKFYPSFKNLFKIRRFGNQRIILVKELIKKFNLTHIPTKDVNNPEFVNKIKNLCPDFIILCFFNQIFKQTLIRVPKYGCINIHRSLLPEYRGVSPTFWALADNKELTGITFHYINEKIDAGDIIAQREVKISKNDTVNTLSYKMVNIIKEMYPKILMGIINGKIREKPMKKSKYYTWPSRESVSRFIKNKKRVF